MNTTNTTAPAVRRQPAPVTTIRGLIEGNHFKHEVAKVLPKVLTPDRFIRVALTAVMRTPKLAECDQASFINSLLHLAQYGLEPDGRRAHLIPFWNSKRKCNECQLIIDWKGLAELAQRSGLIARLHADVICDGDEFAYDMGDVLHHKIDFRKPRGEPYAAWAMAQTKSGERFVQVMTRDEIESVRDRSNGWRAFKEGKMASSPWVSDAGEMWKKTVFRRLSKWLTLSPELRDAVESDDDAIDVESKVVASQSAASLVEVVGNTQPEPEPEGGENNEVADTNKPTVNEHTNSNVGGVKTAHESMPLPPAQIGDTPQIQLANVVTGVGYTFTQWQEWAAGSGVVPEADGFSGFSDVPTKDAVRVLRASKAMMAGLAQVKGVTS